MNPAHSYLAKTEVVKQLGYFPAFLIPAINSSLIFRSLVQQTLTAYVDNYLPDLFKEKLFVVLSRYFGASYFAICHSCTLFSLGTSPTEILALKKVVFPQSEADIAADLALLKSRWHSGKDLQNHLVQDSLLRCSCFIFPPSAQVDRCNTILKELLEIEYYNRLIILLRYIKLCHNWLANNSEISHQKYRRSQLYVGSLLLSDNRLTEFLQSNVQLEISKQNKIVRKAFSVEQKHLLKSKSGDREKVLTNVQIDNKHIEQSQDPSCFVSQYKERLGNSCVPVNNALSKKDKRKNLTEYLISLSSTLMIHGQDEKILYLNHS